MPSPPVREGIYEALFSSATNRLSYTHSWHSLCVSHNILEFRVNHRQAAGEVDEQKILACFTLAQSVQINGG